MLQNVKIFFQYQLLFLLDVLNTLWGEIISESQKSLRKKHQYICQQKKTDLNFQLILQK